eukprot:1391905-Amphidinium_carterae.1
MFGPTNAGSNFFGASYAAAATSQSRADAHRYLACKLSWTICYYGTIVMTHESAHPLCRGLSSKGCLLAALCHDASLAPDCEHGLLGKTVQVLFQPSGHGNWSR